MGKNSCEQCIEYKRCKESAASMAFFIVGLIAIIAVRAVTILEHVNPRYGKAAWYVGILGFVIYFAYKFKVDHNRSRLITARRLKEKMMQGGAIEKEDRELVGSILCALSSRKDRVNYLIIFVSSALVLALAFYLDVLR